MKTAVVDIGMNIIGIFVVEDGKYSPYSQAEFPKAIEILQNSDEVVTYNGKLYDLPELGELVDPPAESLPIKGFHSDMRSICWSDRILGASLSETYKMHFESVPNFPATYEGSNERDCYMTFKLWELWKAGQLKVEDGIENR